MRNLAAEHKLTVRIYLHTRLSNPYRLHTKPHLSINQVLRVIPRILVPLLALLTTTTLLRLSSIVLVKHLLGNPVKQFLGVYPQQLPGLVERLVDGPLLVRTLRDKGALELVEELERELVFAGERLLSDDGFHGGGIATDGVFGVQLVRDIRMVASGVAFADGRLHQTRQRWQDVDWRVDTLVVQLTVDEDLTFGDVACQVGNRMGDVCGYTLARAL